MHHALFVTASRRRARLPACLPARFDDVIRVAPAAAETKRAALELDDSKPAAGLGEVYEKEFVAQVRGGCRQWGAAADGVTPMG